MTDGSRPCGAAGTSGAPSDPLPAFVFSAGTSHLLVHRGPCGGLKFVARPGAFAAIIVRDGIRQVLTGHHEDTTAERQALHAIRVALRTIPADVPTVVLSNHPAVSRALTKGWLKGRKSRGWRDTRGEPCRNARLWACLDGEAAARPIGYREVPSGGHPLAGEASELARVQLWRLTEERWPDGPDGYELLEADPDEGRVILLKNPVEVPERARWGNGEHR